MTEDNVDVDIKVGKSDFQKLLLCERQLIKQQKWLENAINNIKSQRIALEVENLNIQSMMNDKIRKRTEKNKQDEIKIVDIESVLRQDITTLTGEMDSTQSCMNTKLLDLSIDKMIDDIIQTNTYSENESETED